MSIVSQDQQQFLVMAPVGSYHEAVTLQNLVTPVTGGTSVELAAAADGHITWDALGTLSAAADGPTGGVAVGTAASPPRDWAALAKIGVKLMFGVPIRASPDALLAVLNLGYKVAPQLDSMFGTYLHLVAATMTAVVKDPALNKYVDLAYSLQVSWWVSGFGLVRF
jgi:hypothetical protein